MNGLKNYYKIINTNRAISKWRLAPFYFRNKIVHPVRKDNRANLSVEDMWNIIQIGTKYIELIVLSFIGYKGEYSNRLKERWFGEVEVVPWNNTNN